jgi:hypothetical protein
MAKENYVEPNPAVAGNVGAADEEKDGKDFIDQVCDPFGLVPENLEQALAHKQKMKLLKAEEEEAAVNAEAGIETSKEENNAADDDAEDGTMLSTFNIDCCGKTPAAADEVEDKEFPAEKIDEVDEQIMKNGESASVTSQQTRSLADIAAKMDEIDLETAAEDTAGDQISEDGDSSIKKFGDGQVWYKHPLYAGLIFLCGSFGIAIFVMVILLIVNRN